MATDDQRVRTEIVDAARGYFLRFGYSRVSTSEIATAIGRSKKTLYKHFETKEALLLAVLGELNADVEQQIEQLLANDAVDDPVGQVRAVLQRLAVHVASVGGVLFEDLQGKEPALYEQTWSVQVQFLSAFCEQLFAPGQRAGVWRTDVSVLAFLQVFIASVRAAADPLRVAQHADDPAVLFSEIVLLLVDGMRVPTGSS